MFCTRIPAQSQSNATRLAHLELGIDSRRSSLPSEGEFLMSLARYVALTSCAAMLSCSTAAIAGSQYDHLSLFQWYQRSNGEIYFQEQYGRLEKHFVSAAYWNKLKRKPHLSPAPD